jgi:predicted CXXCH cytochrome family protein
MKIAVRSIAGLVLALAVVALAGLAQAGPIDGTRHDFSNTATNTWNTAGYKCQICHTPHGPATTVKPLWNHKLSTAAYSWNPTTTIGGTTLPTNFSTWDGPSKFCLSCHDGTVGIGDLITNSYGIGCGTPSPCVTGINKIGPVMTGNHPVGVPYPIASPVTSNSYNSIASGSGVDLTSYVAAPAVVRVYNDNAGKVSAGIVSGKSGIECGSCHDPHNNVNTRFLRDAQATICQRCHAF